MCWLIFKSGDSSRCSSLSGGTLCFKHSPGCGPCTCKAQAPSLGPLAELVGEVADLL